MAVGPVEYLVITLPAGRFTGAVAPALADAAASQAVRLLDLLCVRRADDGMLVRVELRDLDPEGLVPFDPARATGLLGDEDVEALGRNVPAGGSAALVAWEALWAAPLARAVQEADGTLAADGRAAEDDIITLLERLAELRQQGALTDAEFGRQKAKLLAD
ncbi:DUF6325 family protein [Streptomyces sp. NPDC088729]|uniref:SHOCT domain-containing protein n=1 Tax=Streptomyces sp. NPDC088729 TaxID=3365876 RepID=UPI003828CF34